ncbi:MAG: hypothetical protein COB29_15935 [Sulfitobacter sp.]|nr:MAG: hypothetical protein COB29_15935 [Sulfitobacter sp.]
MVENSLASLDATLVTSLTVLFFTGGFALFLGILVHGKQAEKKMEKRVLSLLGDRLPVKTNTQKIVLVSQIRQNKQIWKWTLSRSCFSSLIIGTVCVMLWRYGDVLVLTGGLFIALGGGVLHFQSLRREKRRKLLSAQFPEVLDLMVRGGRAGVTPDESIRHVAKELPSPLADIFKSMSEQFNIGLSFEYVLSEMARKLELREFRYLAATLTAQRRTGGHYVDVLENLSQVLRDHQEQARKAEAVTSEARLASKIITSLVALSCGSMFFLNRDQFDFFLYDPTGQQLLAYCILSIGFGFFIMQWMLGRFK